MTDLFVIDGGEPPIDGLRSLPNFLSVSFLSGLPGQPCCRRSSIVLWPFIRTNQLRAL